MEPSVRGRLVTTDSSTLTSYIDNQDRLIVKLLSLNSSVSTLYKTMNNGNLCCVVNGSCEYVNMTEDGNVIPHLTTVEGVGLVLDNDSDTDTQGNYLVVKSLPFKRDASITVSHLFFNMLKVEQKAIQQVAKLDSDDWNSWESVDDTVFLGLDRLSNETLVGFIVRNIYDNGEFDSVQDFILRYFWVSTCDSRGVILSELCDLGSISEVVEASSSLVMENVNGMRVWKSSVLQGVISQVASALHYLSDNVMFSFCGLLSSSVLVQDETVTGFYNALTLDCPVKCKIGKLGKGSCTVTRLDGSKLRVFKYDRAVIDDLPTLDRLSVEPDSGVKNGVSLLIDDNFTKGAYPRMKSGGFPCPKSLDYYTFMISLLSVESSFISFFSNSALVERFWKPMWIGEDVNTAFVRLKELVYKKVNSTVTIDDTMAFMSRLRMRSRALDLVVSARL